MNFIEFNDVSFTYPAVEGDLDENGKQIVPAPIYDHFSGTLPGGFTSIIGPNGCGKSTLMLIASGRIIPQNGKVLVAGKDIASLDENQKNLLASIIYQNMEFESTEKVEELLSFVYKNGALKGNAKAINSDRDLFAEVVDVFELAPVMNHGLTEISKGENQRVLLAFSILYGSASIFMDEPLFAMEFYQKENALQYLKDFSKKTGTAIYISMHELELTRKYAENVLLIHPNRDMSLGTPEEVMTNDELEKAYGIPVVMLKHNENMTRETLTAQAEVLKSSQK